MISKWHFPWALPHIFHVAFIKLLDHSSITGWLIPNYQWLQKFKDWYYFVYVEALSKRYLPVGQSETPQLEREMKIYKTFSVYVLIFLKVMFYSTL